MARQDQARITLTVDGRNLGVFAKREGGAVDSEEVKYAPGGMEPEISLGGRVTVENVTLTRVQSLDKLEEWRWLRSRAGKGAAVVVEQPLDAEGNAFGRPDTWSGIVKAVTPPPRDANASEAAELEVEISTHGVVG